MPRPSSEAVITSIRQLARLNLTSGANSALEAFLVAKWLEVRGIRPTIRAVEEAVRALFVVLPDHRFGRIQPFDSQDAADGCDAPKWAVAYASGRKTVWNVSTRGNGITRDLFDESTNPSKPGRRIEAGLRSDAATILGDQLRSAGGRVARPSKMALAIFLLRDQVLDAGDEAELDAKLAANFGLTATDLSAFCDDSALGVPILGGEEWTPTHLPPELRPPSGDAGDQTAVVVHVAATRGQTQPTGPVRLEVDARIRRMVNLAILSYSAVILVGPPGTGKTSLLQETLEDILDDPQGFGFTLEKNEPKWVTPEESWTTRELIGGETVDEQGQLRFRLGYVLEAIAEDRWLVLDEANRADMDKIFGGLLTWLSDRPVQVGRVATNVGAPSVVLDWNDGAASLVDPERIKQLEEPTPAGDPVVFKAGTEWRLLGTYNALDAQRVFRFGQALGRRFARVPIPAPSIDDFRRALTEQFSGLGAAEQADLLERTVGLYAAHYDDEATRLGPALFLRIPRYVLAGLAREASDAPSDAELTDSDAADDVQAPSSTSDGSDAAASQESSLNSAQEPGAIARVSPAALVQLLTEAYLVNVGTWLARLDREGDLRRLGLRIVNAEDDDPSGHAALPQDQWEWLTTLLPSLG